MWDVKFAVDVIYLVFTAFYLNYVGCKEHARMFGRIFSNSFTLTMWDVK